jgi:hypothetical protein
MIKDGICGVFSKVCLILVYISFYFVQLSLYSSQAAQLSLFSENSVIHGHKDSDTVTKDSHNESKSVSFRLNKRFHPKCFFTAPTGLNDLVKYCFGIQTSLLNETQPLTNFSFNSPSLRGPPAII